MCLFTPSIFTNMNFISSLTLPESYPKTENALSLSIKAQLTLFPEMVPVICIEFMQYNAHDNLCFEALSCWYWSRNFWYWSRNKEACILRVVLDLFPLCFTFAVWRNSKPSSKRQPSLARSIRTKSVINRSGFFYLVLFSWNQQLFRWNPKQRWKGLIMCGAYELFLTKIRSYSFFFVDSPVVIT